MTNIKTQLQQFKEKFDPLLFGFLEKQEREVEKASPQTAILVQEIKRTIKAGGKRLRPSLLFYAFKACGGKPRTNCMVRGKKDKECLKLAMALEIFHTCWLLHDDILDDAKLRRGERTVFEKEGLATALLSGDLALILAHSLINQREVFALFNLLNKEVILGEYLDVIYSGKDKRLSKPRTNCMVRGKELIFKIMEYKTARYTFCRPLQIGAILAAGSEKILKGLWQYGLNLGLAFQIQDDILGIFGTEKKLGKSILSDLQEAKPTLLTYETLRLVNKRAKIKFLKIWGKKTAAKKDLEWVKNLMEHSGGLEAVKNQARNCALKAKQNLLKLDIQKKDFFINLADFIIGREF